MTVSKIPAIVRETHFQFNSATLKPMLELGLSECPNVSEPDTSIEEPSLNRPLDLYESAGYRKVNNNIIINQSGDKNQPDCPICTYQFKSYLKNGKKVKPNTEHCPVCGFDFEKYCRSNFNVGIYHQRRKKTIPKLFKVKVKKFNDTNLYKEIHKKWPNEESIKSQISKALQNKWCGDHICNNKKCKLCITNKRNDCRKLLTIIQIAKHHTKLLKQQVCNKYAYLSIYEEINIHAYL